MGSGSQERRLTPERHGVQDNMGSVGDRREMGLARKVQATTSMRVVTPEIG